MAIEFNLQEPSEEPGDQCELDIERMAMELDEFVNEVSMELSVISQQLGQTPDVRTLAGTDPVPVPQKPLSTERKPLAQQPPLAERKPLIDRQTLRKPIPLPRAPEIIAPPPESRIQAIRDRLARVNPGTAADEKGNRKHD